MQHRVCLASLFVGAFLALAVGLLLWLDNPTVDITASDLNDEGPAGKVECTIAPWDAALNNNSDGPGGDHAEAFRDEVAEKCYAANSSRSNAAVASGVLALLLSLAGGLMLLLGAVGDLRSRRRNLNV
ncbi:hypothetical protein ASE01_18655 [Nocardioides sp. Root190]|uniref:hypothetical protein n=1 Tax=Nocardioides sp. Root190 TaxID=1736488 RepID=UPI0006FA0B71|nr:hypothetical protein [Nocardioides sp. Root190]KRB74017.1 hypothetical protein ASE01_18655 [Nocardioides sp. Root190]